MKIWDIKKEGHEEVTEYIRFCIRTYRPYAVYADEGMIDRNGDVEEQTVKLLEGCSYGRMSAEDIKKNNLPDDKCWLDVEPPAGKKGICIIGIAPEDFPTLLSIVESWLAKGNR